MAAWRRWWRWVLIVLGLRRITPRLGERLPGHADRGLGTEGDTGGGGWYRADHTMQDPSVDPREPNGGESSSAGNDHGWSNCTMAAGATALDFATQGDLVKWGGDLRHRQGDLSGGTDLYDLQDAFRSYGVSLSIRSGAGWEALKDDRADGRYLVVQGQGNVPGSATFDGGHACCIAPETNGDGEWLWSDPLASGWQWVSASSIKGWMSAWSSGMAYAMTPAHPPPSEPEPEPVPPTPPPPPPWTGARRMTEDAQARGYQEALDAVFRSWTPGRPRTPLAPWDASSWGEGAWGQVAYPLEGLAGARTPAAWGTPPTTWTGATWRDVTPEPGELTPWDAGAWSSPWSG